MTALQIASRIQSVYTQAEYVHYFSFLVIRDLHHDKHMEKDNDYRDACGACGISLQSMAAGQFSLLPVSLLPLYESKF